MNRLQNFPLHFRPVFISYLMGNFCGHRNEHWTAKIHVVSALAVSANLPAKQPHNLASDAWRHQSMAF